MLPAPGFHQAFRLGEDDKRHLQVLSPRRPLSSIQRKFKSFLLSLENPQWVCKGGCLMRFWTTTPTRSKRKRLSISEQPFGEGKACSGVYRYRYHCIQYAIGLKDIREGSVTSEFSLNLESYSIEEFPLKNYAKDCGLQGYLALPICEPQNDRQPQQRGSTGVLEILTFTENISLDAIFLEKLKGVGLAIRCPTPCRKPEGCRGRSDICTLVQQLRKHNIKFGSTDDQEFSAEFSHMDDVFNAVYHKVHRSSCRTDCRVQCHVLGNGKEDPKMATVQEDDGQHCQIKNRQLGEAAKKLDDDQVQSHELGNVKEDHEEATVQEDNVQHYWVKNRQLGEASRATKRLKGDQVQSHEAPKCHGEKQWLSLLVEQPNSETADGCFFTSVEQPSLETTGDEKNPQVTTEDSGEPGPKIRKREITRDMIQNSFGRRLTDVAKELKVHKSTLKRWCRSYGIERWPSPKINKPGPDLKPSNELGGCGGKDQECDSRPSPDHNSREKQVTDVNGPGNYNFDHSHFLTVKARYNECLVKFPFSARSGIEALLRSLGMRFKLDVERIRAEYEDEDGDKVMISCDEDLSYHMYTLSSSGRTRMDLFVHQLSS